MCGPTCCQRPTRAKVRSLLRRYADERILFYTTRDFQEEQKINARTAQLQNELWAAIVPAATANPTPVMALVVNGMNDVLNSQGYTQAAWWNRIPPAAWLLMTLIAAACCLSVGYGAQGLQGVSGYCCWPCPSSWRCRSFSLPTSTVRAAGVIRVVPQNLLSLAESLGPK